MIEIDHPLLFVGIGGTGGQIGMELERRLRQEICGPGGSDWLRDAYELPSCFQSLYIDIDESDLLRLRNQEPGHEAAVARTMRVASELEPTHHSYAEVRQFLHTSAGEQVRHFLPPADGEPRVAPLSRGAAQFPTVARANLFARIRQAGIEAVQGPMLEAVARLQDCKVDLASLGGLNAKSCDVFLAFSVAGGTGNGLFYDVAHLVVDAFENKGMSIQIFPLVVMPSAFDEGSGGGRIARLNAGRGLLDLARLVDDQNMRGVNPAYRRTTTLVREEHGVTYRDRDGLKVIQMRPSTLQTAFLFSKDGGLTDTQLRGSIASFILSMAGVRSASSAQDGHSTGRQSSFINEGVDRQKPAPSGIGGRGISTAFVTSLAVPRNGIIELFTKLLIAKAIRAWSKPRPDEDNTPLRDAFLQATNILSLKERPYRAERRADGIRSRRFRGERANEEIKTHSEEVRGEVATMASGFEPGQGLAALALAPWYCDPFRAERAMEAVASFLRWSPPPPGPLPAGHDKAATSKWLSDTSGARWTFEWLDKSAVWEPKLRRTLDGLHGLTDELTRFERDCAASASGDMAAIFAEDGTARQFVHNVPRDPEEFYRWFAERLALSLKDSRDTDPLTLLEAVLGGNEPFTRLTLGGVNPGIGAHAQEALFKFRERVSEDILAQTKADGGLLPHLADLIAPKARGNGVPGAVAVHSALRGLVSTGALMAATGPVKVLISYPVPHASGKAGGEGPGAAAGAGPRLARNKEVEDYLRETIDIGAQPGLVTYEMRPTSEETLTVALMRTALGITDIPEARQVLALWAEALRQGAVKDKLTWRQRLGYDFTWLLTTEEQRVDILQRLLIAMRNGQLDVLLGTEERPEEIAIRASVDPGGSAARLELPLRPWSGTSPWADLLHAYEESSFAGDELNRQELYAALMEVMPRHAGGQFATASTVYEAFRKVRVDEITRLESLLAGHLNQTQRLHVEGLLGFWASTVPNALARTIQGLSGLEDSLDTIDAAQAGPGQGAPGQP
jgi:hypothetical protein